VAERIRQLPSDPRDPLVVYVSGEPALVYHLWRAGVPATNAAALTVTPPPGVQAVLAIGPVTRVAHRVNDLATTLAADYELLAQVEIAGEPVSSLVRLDLDPPAQRELQADRGQISLWRQH
jgi:hypothetical protein